MGRSPSRCSAEYALGIPEVCIELTSAVLEPPLKLTVFSNTVGIRYVGSGQRLLRSIQILDFAATTFNNETWTSMPSQRRTGEVRDSYYTHAIVEQNIYHDVTLDTKQINSEDTAMDKDRVKGSAEQVKGAVKEAAGKVFGDKKLETDGNADKAAGKVQNAIGGLKDAVRGK